MSLASIAQDQAYAAVKRVGATAVLTQNTPGAFDPATGTAGNTAVVTNTVATLDATSLRTLGFRFGDGLVQSGDILIVIPAKGLASDIKPGDSALVRGALYAVKGVRPVFLGASVVVYDCLGHL